MSHFYTRIHLKRDTLVTTTYPMHKDLIQALEKEKTRFVWLLAPKKESFNSVVQSIPTYQHQQGEATDSVPASVKARKCSIACGIDLRAHEHDFNNYFGIANWLCSNLKKNNRWWTGKYITSQIIILLLKCNINNKYNDTTEFIFIPVVFSYCRRLFEQ